MRSVPRHYRTQYVRGRAALNGQAMPEPCAAESPCPMIGRATQSPHAPAVVFHPHCQVTPHPRVPPWTRLLTRGQPTFGINQESTELQCVRLEGTGDMALSNDELGFVLDQVRES